MNKKEIAEFIERTGEFGDEWTPEQVEDIYGDRSLEEAWSDRKSLWEQHVGNVMSLVDL